MHQTTPERGSALVETALTIPVVLALVFGIVDFGAVLNNSISVRQGARDAMRQAIVDTTPAAPGGGSWSCPITGSQPTTGSDAHSMVCFTKNRVGLTESNTRVKIYFVSPFKSGQPVKVCVQYPQSSLSGVYSKVLNGKVLNAQVESLIEQDEAGFTTPYEETPLTSWPSSCSTL